MAFGRRLVSAPMALRILYVMDPMTRVLVDKDTTFAFQLEGQKRGHEQDAGKTHAGTYETGTLHWNFPRLML